MRYEFVRHLLTLLSYLYTSSRQLIALSRPNETTEEKKTEWVDIYFLVFLMDVLCRGWIEEWIGIGLRVGLGVY